MGPTRSRTTPMNKPASTITRRRSWQGQDLRQPDRVSGPTAPMRAAGRGHEGPRRTPAPVALREGSAVLDRIGPADRGLREQPVVFVRFRRSTESGRVGEQLTSPSPLAFSACMRSHGVPTFPDPDSSGAIPKAGPQQLGVSTSRFQQAQSACQPTCSRRGGSADWSTLHGAIQRPGAAELDGMRTSPSACAPTGCRTGPTPPPIARGACLRSSRPDQPGYAADRHRIWCMLTPSAPRSGQDGAILCNGIGEGGCHHYGRPS